MNASHIPTPGTTVPLPHLGRERTGTVLAIYWSESLGRIMRVREDNRVDQTILLYGPDLVAALAAWSDTTVATLAVPLHDIAAA